VNKNIGFWAMLKERDNLNFVFKIPSASYLRTVDVNELK
jgi:hypothetical protein